MPVDTTTLRVVHHPMQTDAVSESTEVCEKCGETLRVGSWPFCPHPGGVSLVTEKSYPFTTRNFDGKPIEVTSRAHEKALMEAHGVVKRDDVGWINKEYLGYNRHTGKQEYKEANGVGLPGCWV
jgi:hypothetical protein